MKVFLIFITSLFWLNVPSDKAISFTLHNSSIRSIPLEIPGVMNPNLSPFSDSGVSLKVGQKIFFTYKGKRALLLTVDEKLEGQKVDVHQLIKKRKKELKTKQE